MASVNTSGIVKVNGLTELKKGLTELERDHFPFAVAKTLTNLAWSGKKGTVTEMKRVFDRPTPFTLNSLYVTKATKAKLQSRVWFKPPARIREKEHYLTPQVRSGKRIYKPFEAALRYAGVLKTGYYAIPTKYADIDAYGNMSKGQIVQILSYFQAFKEQGFRANMTDKSKQRLGKTTTKKYGIRYFAVRPGQHQTLYPGIYKAVNSSFGEGIIRILSFIPKRDVEYWEVLDLVRVGNDVYQQLFNVEFTMNLEEAVNTAFNR